MRDVAYGVSFCYHETPMPLQPRLDEHPDLILWEDYFDKETNTMRREKFAEPSSSSN